MKKILNIVSARTQPASFHKWSEKSFLRSLLHLIWLCWSSYSWIIMFKNSRGQPNRFMICHIPPLLTESNSLIRFSCFAPGTSLGAVEEQPPCLLCSNWFWSCTGSLEGVLKQWEGYPAVQYNPCEDLSCGGEQRKHWSNQVFTLCSCTMMTALGTPCCLCCS